jgi:hypothetical protein
MTFFTSHQTRFLVAAIGTMIMAVNAVAMPQVRDPSLLFVLLGLTFTWREYQSARPS